MKAYCPKFFSSDLRKVWPYIYHVLQELPVQMMHKSEDKKL